ncbi:hypothetical protein Vretimale_14174 [Volvox reticuliferus]|uniref:Uncharacterized protein n=1 Tax=Volvox reticuliferus TaxID=1737510 RepID=A0A8J4CQK9_9CHLO|nr:hypothetical protein Vretifemale_15202 [Volvox reticuliferus]GIM10577.1 hypothetical protein Vretimale_14174 [Volvox reticuliferus]
MAASGASLLRQRQLRSGQATISIPPITLAKFGFKSILRPTQVSVCSAMACTRQASAFPQNRRRRGRQLVVRAVAMVNVDFASPSLLLGTMLIGCGVLLLNLRNFQNKVSRDADIVVAAMVSIVGSTLIFQGWRLDPLLLLCQALTTSVAFWYGLETFRLRSKEADLPPPQLPPGLGSDSPPLDPVQQAAAAAAAAQQQQYYQANAGFPPGGPGIPFLPAGSESYYPWGSPAADSATSTSGRAVGSFNETIQYDYYGNPIMPQEPVYSSSNNGGVGGYSAYNEAAAYGGSGNPSYDAGGGGSGGVAYGGGGGVYGAGGGPASSGYGARGSPVNTPASSYGGPYASVGPSPPPSQVPSGMEEGQQQPSASSSGSSSSSYFGQGAPPVPFGGRPGALYDGFGASSANPGPAGQGLGSTVGGGNRGKGTSRLDLFEQVDDWE